MGISRAQALDCLRSDDLIGMGMEADAVRRRLHPEGVVSYAVAGTIDSSGAGEGPAGRIYDEIRKTIEMGGSGVRLACGHHAGAKACEMERLEGMLRGIRQSFPSLWLEGPTATEALVIARSCGLGVRETIARLRDAGLDSIAGEDATVFEGQDWMASPRRKLEEWVEVHRAAHELGMRTTATMVFGGGAGEAGGESMAQRIDSLEAVRRLQERTGGFAAFLPVAVEAPGGRELDGVTAVERLKTLAVSRMFLDTIENVQASAAGQGLKVLQMGLRFGGNDVGSVAAETNGAKSAGRANRATEEDLRRVIRDAGFKPVQRDMAYRAMFLN